MRPKLIGWCGWVVPLVVRQDGFHPCLGCLGGSACDNGGRRHFLGWCFIFGEMNGLGATSFPSAEMSGLNNYV